ncbi:MAG: EAL domain-containing protein [Methyloligellaceae bacterium]
MLFKKLNNNLAFILCAMLLLVMLSLTVNYVAEYTEEKLALEDSNAFTSMIMDMQSFYASEVVAHAKKNHIKVKKDYKDAGTAIPFPATFTHEFIKKLNEKYHNRNFHFYSDQPFYKRVGGGPRDKFEREALNYFKSGKSSKKHIIQKIAGDRYLRYARAIRMEKGCVQCHNSHPDSPHKNWSIGDLRGVHSLKIKLPGFSIFNNKNLNPLTNTIVALYVLVAFFVFLLLFAMRKLQNEFNQKRIIQDQNNQLKSAESTIALKDNRDTVTDLPNRKSFYEFVKKQITKANQNGYGFSVIVLDLDNFKNINDRYGHHIGDSLLKAVGQRLKSLTTEEDIVARLGGDEYAICFNRLTNTKQISKLTQSIIREFDRPVIVENKLIDISATIGVSRFPTDGDTTDLMISNASIALETARTDGTQKCWFFDKNLQNRVRQNDLLEIDLKEAITNNELDIFYQPKVCLRTGEIAGFEALIRWPHANQGFISPEDFLPIAEERGLIIPVSRYVARRVAFDMATWLDKKMLKGRIAVNVHSHQLKNMEEMEVLIDIFDEHGIPPEYLTLEITEGCVMGHGSENTFGILEQLSKRGIKISLDDFGTGFASLTHLKKLPVQEVKIDKSFLQDITTNTESEAIVCAIIDLSKKIGLEVVAEGIETQEQLQKLKDMDCDIGQGFLFSPPAMMIVANGLLSLPNLFKDTVLTKPYRPKEKYKLISVKNS